MAGESNRHWYALVAPQPGVFNPWTGYEFESTRPTPVADHSERFGSLADVQTRIDPTDVEVEARVGGVQGCRTSLGKTALLEAYRPDNEVPRSYHG